MKAINYKPELSGKHIYNKGKLVTIRKFHLKSEEIVCKRNEFRELVKDVPVIIKTKSNKKFFNPYVRRGIYFYQIQTLYLLGCNSYHSLFSVLGKIKKVMPMWEKFKLKEHRKASKTNKGYIGRVIENYFFFQRINGLNPYGYKLRQAFGAIDVKIRSHKELGKVYHFRLSTYNNFEDSIPERDLIGYNGNDAEKYKVRFGGRILE